MLPLHPGHPGHEAALIVVLAVVVLSAAFALTRDGRSRVAGLLGVGIVAAGSRIAVGIVGIHGSAFLHVAGHGLELGAVVAFGLAGGYALLDALTSTQPVPER